jgi:hypothetical protein
MSWNRSYLQYKKLVKELLFVYSEKEYMDEVLKSSHNDFERYYLDFCKAYGINKEKFEKRNAENVEKLLPSPQEQAEDETGRVPLKAKPPPKKDAAYRTFNRIYRLIAKKIHPDKFSNLKKTEEIIHKEEMFKQASSAFNEQNWGSLLDVAEKLDIKPHSFDGLNRRLRDEISNVRKQISEKENVYSWKFHLCEEDEECRRKLMKHFVKQLFNLEIP